MPAQNLTAVDLDAQIDWFGTYVIVNEQVALTNSDPVLSWGSNLLGLCLRQTEDELKQSELDKLSLMDLETEVAFS